MLILTRNIGETIVIGKDIEVTVVASTEGTVRLGITAPRDVGVWREELLDDGVPHWQREGTAGTTGESVVGTVGVPDKAAPGGPVLEHQAAEALGEGVIFGRFASRCGGIVRAVVAGFTQIRGQNKHGKADGG